MRCTVARPMTNHSRLTALSTAILIALSGARASAQELEFWPMRDETAVPAHFDVDGDHRIYFNTVNHTVHRFDPRSGDIVNWYPSGFETNVPGDLLVDPRRPWVWMTAYSNAIGRLDTDGDDWHVWPMPVEVRGPRQLAVDERGDVWFSAANGIGVLHHEVGIVAFWTPPLGVGATIAGMVRAEDGSIYFAVVPAYGDIGNISRLDPATNQVRSWWSHRFTSGGELVMDGSGAIFEAGSGADGIARFVPSANQITFWEATTTVQPYVTLRDDGQPMFTADTIIAGAADISTVDFAGPRVVVTTPPSTAVAGVRTYDVAMIPTPTPRDDDRLDSFHDRGTRVAHNGVVRWGWGTSTPTFGLTAFEHEVFFGQGTSSEPAMIAHFRE